MGHSDSSSDSKECESDCKKKCCGQKIIIKCEKAVNSIGSNSGSESNIGSDNGSGIKIISGDNGSSNRPSNRTGRRSGNQNDSCCDGFVCNCKLQNMIWVLFIVVLILLVGWYLILAYPDRAGVLLLLVAIVVAIVFFQLVRF